MITAARQFRSGKSPRRGVASARHELRATRRSFRPTVPLSVARLSLLAAHPQAEGLPRQAQAGSPRSNLTDTERPTVTKYLLTIVPITLALAAVAAPATAQTPSYTPPPNWDAAPKHPGPGGANTFICA